MLKKEELIDLLRNAGLEEQTIDRILNKRIKKLLAQGKADEIEKIFQVLDNHGIGKETIKNCLTVLALGKADEIEKIFQVLDDHGIGKETIENCLYVLALGKADEIGKIFKILDDNEIKKENVEENYGILFCIRNVRELEELFLGKPETNLLLYMKLKGYYNRFVNQEEINEICNYKKLSNKELFMRIGPENLEDILLQTLYKKGSIYVGKSREMTKEQMEMYSKILLNISKNVSKNIAYQYGEKDISELESMTINIIIEKCGDTIYNTEISPEVMSRCIYNKCKKYLIGRILLLKKQKRLSFDKIKEGNPDTKLSMDEKQKTDYNTVNSLDLQQWNLTNQQEEILKTLSDFLENGYNYEEALNNVASIIDMDKEELIYEMEEIKSVIKETKKEIEK